MEQKEKIANLRKKIKLIFQLIQDNKNISTDTKEALFYIFSELADNIEQHSQAKHFILEFNIDNGKIKIKVSDDGIGIPKLFSQKFPDDLKNDFGKIKEALNGLSTKGEGRGFGLRTTRQIIEKLNGELIFVSGGSGLCFQKNKEKQIKTNTAEGTQILILLPQTATIKKEDFYKIIEGK